MTEILTRNRLAWECNARIRDRINSGISWGTNNFPPNSIPGWFAGDTNGLALTVNAGSFTGGASHAQQAKDVFRYIAQSMSGIRLCRIQIHMSGQGLIQDNTAVANTVYGVGDFVSAAPLGSITNGATMHIWGVSNDLDDLYNRYHQAARVNPLLLSNTICHVSCHVNCHCARGRR